jgi:hypothetical protein
MQKLIDLKMDVDKEASSTISLLPAAVITGPAESRAGSGAVPNGLHFSKNAKATTVDKVCHSSFIVPYFS